MGQKKIWLPKSLIPPKSMQVPTFAKRQRRKTRRSQTKSRKPKRPTTNNHQRQQTVQAYKWVPKDTLTAQGYYEGTTQIWLPKGLLHATKPPSQQVKKDTESIHTPTRQI